MQSGFPVAIVGDSKFLVDCCLGRASTDNPALSKMLRVAHEALQQLIVNFAAKCFSLRELMVHTPRGDNAAADAAANRALDHGNFENTYLPELGRFAEHLLSSSHDQVGLVFAFDGASRGNPGDASCGSCGWWGTWGTGGFDEKGLLFQRGHRLGTQTNNVAEVRG